MTVYEHILQSAVMFSQCDMTGGCDVSIASKRLKTQPNIFGLYSLANKLTVRSQIKMKAEILSRQ
jgi:hypothetical protein